MLFPVSIRGIFLCYHREVLLGIEGLDHHVAARWDLQLVDQVGQDVALELNVSVRVLYATLQAFNFLNCLS